jgi:segregation and condensation protein A
MDTPIFHLEKVVKAKTEDLEDFTGPLDLILSLLSKNKMEIKDIQISVILEQYLVWMSRCQQLDLEIASEFVTMAAQLVFIKTRMLLSINDQEALTEMEQLIASLEEHRCHESFSRVKAVIPALFDRFAIGSDYMAKVPETVPVDKEYRYAHKREELRAAMLAVLDRIDSQLPPSMEAFESIVGREPYPVGDKAAEILHRLVQFGVMSFRALFKGNRSRSEIVATFIAVLELCRAKRILLAGMEADCTVACIQDGRTEELELSTDLY